MARALGGYHEYVHKCGRHDLTEVNVKAMGKSQGVTFFEVGLNFFAVDFGLKFIRYEYLNNIGFGGGFTDGHRGDASFYYQVPFFFGGFVKGLP